MKKFLSAVAGAVAFVAVLCFGLRSCDWFMNMDLVAQTEASVKKYGEMAAFFDTGCVFMEGTLDVDLGILVCKFKLGEPRKMLLASLENGGWTITRQDGEKTILTQKSKRVTWKDETDTLEIKFNPDNTITTKWK